MDKKRTTSSFRAMSTERKLESIFLFVTGRCNAKCAMCFYAQEMDKKQPDLTFDEIKKISETAGQFNRLWISGGEPTLREDLPEILELFYKNNHIKDVNIPTNGLKPDRIVEWVKRFRQNCPDCNINVSLSLDGFGTTHDTQRGVPGNFYKALETLRKIQENFGDDGKVLKNIATVITKYNINQIEDFMTWVYGRFRTSTHTIEAARGMTRDDGVKILTESTLRKIQDDISPLRTVRASFPAYGSSNMTVIGFDADKAISFTTFMLINLLFNYTFATGMYKCPHFSSIDNLLGDAPRSFTVYTFSTNRAYFILSFPNVY